MKKILALLLALALCMSMTPAFAEGEVTEGETSNVFVPSAENYDAIGNEMKVTESWYISDHVPYPASGNFFSTKFVSYRVVVYKIALPAPANGQTYDKFVLRFGVGANGGAAFKMPGEDWDMTQSFEGTEWYTTITNSSKANTLAAYEGSIIYGPEAHSYRNAYADITEYAKECWYAGQDYMYVAVGCVNSTSGVCQHTVSDSSYVQFAPTTLHSFKTVEAPAALENTAEAMLALGNETRIRSANGFYSSAGTVTAAPKSASVKIIDGKFVIVKIDLPVIPTGYTLGNFAFRYGNTSNSREFEVYKMPDVYGELPTDIKGTTWYANIKARNSAYKANDAAVVTTDGLVSSSYKLGYFNITSYIKECYAKGYEYCYLAYGCGSTINAATPTTTDTTYTSNGLQPRFFYSLANIGALEFVSSNPEKGGFTTAKEATFTFNNKLASATATVDGAEYPCTVENNQVKLSFADAGKYTVQITAKDTARQTVTTDAVNLRVGYESLKLTDGVAKTYMVNSSGSTRSSYTSNVNTGMATIFVIPLPTLEPGKKLGEFKMKFLTEVAYDPAWYHLFEIHEDPERVADFTTAVDAPEGKVSVYEYFVGAPDVYKADLGRFVSESTNLAWGDAFCNASYADLTNYANECIERGQKNMLLGFRTSLYTKGILGIGDSSHTYANRFHYTYWTVEDADFTAKAPKFVASSDANTFANAKGLESLAKNSEYKFITSLANFGDADASVTLYIAQYAGDELIGVAPVTVTVPANGTAADFTSANITIDALASKVKAFIWNDAEQKPALIGDVIAEAK